jgi:hypothetical protein
MSEQKKRAIPLWAPWGGVAFLLAAMFVFEYLNVGGRGLAIAGLIFAVLGAIMTWKRLQTTAQRVTIAIIPGLLAPVLFGLYLNMRYGEPDQPTAGYEQQYEEPDYDQPPAEDGSHPIEPQTDQVVPSEDGWARMSTTEERLRTVSALIPLGSDSMNEPSIDWDNDAWLAWVDHYMNVVPNPETTYDGPHHGEYWPSYAAVAEIDGGLDAQPAEVSNRSATTTSIWDTTSTTMDWIGKAGRATRCARPLRT